MQHELNLPMLKLKGPKDVCWLSYDGAISAFRKTFPAVLLELQRQAITDAAAKAWGKRIKCYEFVASLHMLSDAVPILAKASKKFQSATVNFALVEVVLEATINGIQLLKESPSETENFIANLRSEDPALDIVIPVSDARRESFDWNVRKAYLQALIDCLRQRFPSLPVTSALGIFDSRNLPARNSIATYGIHELELLITHLQVEDDDDVIIRIDRGDGNSAWQSGHL